MKLHLPKMLLTAVLAAAQVFAEQVVYLSDNATNSITYTESGRLLYDHSDTDGLINFTGDIDLSTYTIWVGPGTNGAQQASQSTRVELSGVISGSEALNLNEYSSASGGDVVYVLSNADNTFSGTVNLAHGGDANSYVQLSLTSNSLSSATVEFENKSKEILSIEANATLMGIKGSNGNGNLITSTSADNTLTLAGTGSYSYAGTIGSGNYIDSNSSTFTTTTSTSVTSTVLNIAKTGSGTQTFGGTVKLGTVGVSAGTLNLSGTSTLTTANVTGGTLNLSGTSNGGTYTADGGAINVGTLTVSSGTLSLKGSGTVLNQTVTNNATFVTNGVTIADLSAFDSTTNGVVDTSAASGIQKLGTTYHLVKGSGSSSGTVIYGDTTYNIADGIADTSNTYYIADGDSISSTADTASSADVFYTDGTLTIDGNTSDILTVNKILYTTAGSGDIVLSSAATLKGTESTLNTGKLTLQAKLNLGEKQADTASIAGNSSIVFDGGSIELHNTSATLNNVEVTTKGGSIYSYDMGAKNDGCLIKLADTTTLTGDLTVSSYYNAQLEIEKLSGAGNLVFSGSGQNEALYAEISSAENFTGKVKVTGNSQKTYLTIAENMGVNVEYSTANESEINLANIGTGNSVTLTGAIGYFTAGTSANLILTNTSTAAGMEIKNGSSDAVYEFSGKVSGTGNMVFNKALDRSMTLKFSGDVSEWTGLMVVRAGSNHVTYTGDATHVANSVIAAATGDSSKTTTLTFDHAAAATVDSTITNTYWENSGTMNVSVSNTAAEGTTFNGEITVNTLTVTDGTLATIKGTATTSILTTNGEINVANGGSLTYAGKTKVEAVSENSAASITSTTIGGAKVTFSGSDGVTENRTIANSTIDNQNTGIATVTLGGQNLSLLATNGDINVMNTSVAEIAIVTVADAKTISAYITNSSDKATLSVTEAATFGAGASLNANLTLNDSVALTLGEGGLDMNDSVLTLGSSLTLNSETVQRIMELAEGSVVALFTNVSELILGEQHYTAGSLTADNGGVALSEVFNLTMPTELTAAANTSYYLGFDNGMVYAAQIVPEPTTATLSLLALAALAARRRRR